MENIPKDHAMFSAILRTLETRSTCRRVHVGCLIVRDGRIISTGWNGVPSGMMHCEDLYCNENPEDPAFKDVHHAFAAENEIHAEQNAIAYAARNGISTGNATAYISISPCMDCAKLIVASGIREVYFAKKYDRYWKPPVALLERAGVDVSLI